MAHGNWVLDELARRGSSVPALAELTSYDGRERLDHEGSLPHVVFPSTAVVSIVHVTRTGAAEVGMVGRTGMVGVEAVLGGCRLGAGSFARVQVAGAAWRVPRAELAAAIEREPTSWPVVAGYMRVALVEARQLALCGLLHTIEERVCRWLLTTADHAERDRFAITQELLAEMLGVRRASVNEVARALSTDGLVSYRPGEMELVDRVGLERRSCDCYRFLRTDRERFTARADEPGAASVGSGFMPV